MHAFGRFQDGPVVSFGYAVLLRCLQCAGLMTDALFLNHLASSPDGFTEAGLPVFTSTPVISFKCSAASDFFFKNLMNP